MDVIKTELGKRDILRLNNMESNKLTRECIETALVYLMSEKAFEHITITDIVKRSGVSRTSFYRNYSTKEDVLNAVAREVTEKIEETIRKNNIKTQTRKWFFDCFNTIKNNEQTVALLLKANFPIDKLFPNGSIVEIYYPTDNKEERYYRMAASAAFIKILYEWFIGGMEESCEKMSEMCMNIFKLLNENKYI